MLNVNRIPRKLIGYFILLAMFNWLVLPLGVKEKRVFAEENQPLTESEIKNIGSKVPLFFEANQGQHDKRVKFSARGAAYKLFLTSSEAVYVIPERKVAEAQNPKSESELPALESSKSSRAVSIWMKLAGANQNAEAVGVDEIAGKHNYFKGSDESKWQTNVPLYQKARFENVYEGIDVEWRSNDAGSIEHDFKVSPFASTREIEWQIEGADKVTVEADGSLTISTPFGELKQNAPVTFQETDGLRSAVESRFEQRGETSVGFTVWEYDRSKLLTIDPVTDLSYLTFLGGKRDEFGRAIAYCGGSTVYVTGSTFSNSLPTTGGVSTPQEMAWRMFLWQSSI